MSENRQGQNVPQVTFKLSFSSHTLYFFPNGGNFNV